MQTITITIVTDDAEATRNTLESSRALDYHAVYAVDVSEAKVYEEKWYEAEYVSPFTTTRA